MHLPTKAQHVVLLDSFRFSLDAFGGDGPAAEKFIANTGEAPRDQGLDVKALAAYTNVASLILNLNQVVTKE